MEYQQQLLDVHKKSDEKFQQILDKFQVIELKVNKVEIELTAIRQHSHNAHEALRAITEKHEHDLRGNGKEGLIVEHDRTKQVVKVISWVCGITVSTVMIALVRHWIG